jgi:hypothetical protein
MKERAIDLSLSSSQEAPEGSISKMGKVPTGSMITTTQPNSMPL